MTTLAVAFVAKKRRLTGSLSDRLKLLLGEQDKTVTQLADELGVHRVHVSRVVNGKATNPSLSLLRGLATALGVKVGDLVDDGG